MELLIFSEKYLALQDCTFVVPSGGSDSVLVVCGNRTGRGASLTRKCRLSDERIPFHEGDLRKRIWRP